MGRQGEEEGGLQGGGGWPTLDQGDKARKKQKYILSAMTMGSSKFNGCLLRVDLPGKKRRG